jgi:hypothetical protein
MGQYRTNMDSSVAANITAAVLGGLLSGLGAVVGALWAVGRGLRKLERQEVRRQQVQCIVNLYGSRVAIAPNNEPQPENRQRFFFELNKVGVLFADSTNVRECLRAYRTNGSTSNLITLVKAMCECVDIDASSLTNDDVETVLTPKQMSATTFGSVG